ncbi:MAG TPA: CxxxxCH/CxxCH domain-containing protein, partial [Polyangia bacterium]
YRASGQTGGVNPYAAGAGQCFDCHETAAAGTLPWGYQSTFGASAPILGYRDRARFGPGPSGPTTRYAFRSSRAVAGGHLKASAPLASPPMGTIDGLCTPCHDPHGVSPTLGSKQAYAVPLLRGTWLTSPYKEDAPIAVVFENYPGNNPPTPNVYIDQNTFGPGNKVTEDADLFGGLCLRCHPKATLTDGQNHNQPWRSLDRVHEAVKGWGANTQHNYTCSKCHQPHASGLPRLMRTNALDHTHRGRVASGGKPLCQDPGTCARGSYPKGYGYRMQNCHPGTWPDNRWNNRTPW